MVEWKIDVAPELHARTHLFSARILSNGVVLLWHLLRHGRFHENIETRMPRQDGAFHRLLHAYFSQFTRPLSQRAFPTVLLPKPRIF